MYTLRFCMSRPQMIEYRNLGPDFKMNLPPEKYRISAANLTMFADDSLPVEEAEKILLLYAYEYFREDAPSVVIARNIVQELDRRNVPHEPLDEQKVLEAQQTLTRARANSQLFDVSAPNIPPPPAQPKLTKEELQKRIELLTSYLQRVESGNPENAARVGPMIYQQLQNLHKQLLSMEATGG